MNDNNVSEYTAILNEIKKPKVGIFPHMMVPIELLYAAQVHPIQLCLGGNDELTSIGTEYLTSGTCPLSRGTLGYFKSEHDLYDKINYIIGGNYCNGDLTTTEMINLYFNRELIPIVFPTTSKPEAMQFFYKEVISFKKKLEEIFELTIEDEQINDAIKKYNEMRALFREIDNKRIENSIINYVELQELIYQAMILGPDYIIDKLKGIKERYNQNGINNEDNINNNINNDINNDRNRSSKGKKIILTGSLIALGDDFLQLLLDLDINLMVNDTEFGVQYYEKDIERNNEDPLKDLTEYYLKSTTAARMYPNETTIPRAINFYRKYNASGVINHILKFCDPYVALKSYLKDEIQKENIPVLEIERDYSPVKGQLKTRIQAFLEMI
ncbi:MAG: hypothetical protein GF329_20380 [Candidatus Lokiarchaeota archaeon]|nr:hypothetical protein [Candidatus Lokiarchaeota archaeon]